MDEPNLYKTTNFHVAVWLMMNNITLLDIDQTNKRRLEFIFEEFLDKDFLLNSFFQQEQLQNYISKSQELKARMYATHSPEDYVRNN
jgi:hypothetical protein